MVIMANVLARENTRSWQCSATTSGMQAMQQSDRSQVTAESLHQLLMIAITLVCKFQRKNEIPSRVKSHVRFTI